MSSTSETILIDSYNPNHPWALGLKDVRAGQKISFNNDAGKIFSAFIAGEPFKVSLYDGDGDVFGFDFVVPLIDSDSLEKMNWEMVTLSGLGIIPRCDQAGKYFWSGSTYCLEGGRYPSRPSPRKFSLGAILKLARLDSRREDSAEAYRLMEFMTGTRRGEIQYSDEALRDCRNELYGQFSWLQGSVRPEGVGEFDWRKRLEESYGAIHEVRPISYDGSDYF